MRKRSWSWEDATTSNGSCSERDGKMISEWSKNVLEEFAYFMTGGKLGSGMSRQVYVHPFDKTKVIKVENSEKHFQNITEWEFWDAWKHDKEVCKWLAPCHYISQNGTFLIMDRTKPLKKVPEKLPSFLTDHKPANFGLLKGRIVCHDYAKVITNLPMSHRRWRGEKI
jgi:hypothetical protein